MVFPRSTGRLFYIGYFPGLFQQIVVIIYIYLHIMNLQNKAVFEFNQEQVSTEININP